MGRFASLFFLTLLILVKPAAAQKIVYSEPDKNDTRRMKFDIIGKIGGNFLIYKNTRAQNVIAVYDNDMKEIASEEHEYIPDDRLINIDFYPYADYFFAIYEYQKKSVVYCDAVKIDGMGKRLAPPVTLDTTHLGFFNTNNKIYSTVSSEDHNQIMLFKINSKNKSNYVLTTLLLDNQLAIKQKSIHNIPMDERDDYIDNFDIDNNGDLVFTKYTRVNSENVKNVNLIWKPAMSDTLTAVQIPLNDLLLDDIHLKIDNVNKRYFLTSFYTKRKRDNIEGFYFYVWDKNNRMPAMQNAVAFSDELRKEARGDAGIKNAFNDYFIKDITVKKDGGFVIGTEAFYTTSRYNNWNRWDYLYGSPYSSYDYYSYSPFYSWSWRNRVMNQSVRYHSNNITILSFDNLGNPQWNNVIHKEQYDDESDDRLSYMTMNTGGQLHYLFNIDEKRALLLNDYTLSPKGEINRNPTLKNLDRGYEFMPRYGKQVSSKQAIIPCFNRNYICFAKVDYNFYHCNVIALFKQKSPANIVLLLIFGLVIKLPLFLYPREIKPTLSDGTLYRSLVSMLARSGPNKTLLAAVLAFSLIYIQALMVNYLINEYRMTARQSFLPAMSYILITSLFPDWSFLSPGLVANTFILWAFIRIFRLYNASSTNGHIFNVGLIMGIVSFIYLPGLVLILPAFLGVIILKPFRLNEFFLLLLGVTAPYYFYAGYLFFADQFNINKLIPQFHFLIPVIKNSLWLTGSILLLGIPFLIGGYFVQTNLRRMLIQARKNWSIMLLYLLIALFVPLLNSEGNLQNWVIAGLPFAAFHAAGYLYPERNWIPSVLFFLTLSFVLVQQYFLFIH